MATITLPTLINEDYFKKNSPIPNNYNIEEIKPYFYISEVIWVKPLIGDALYSELLSQVTRNEVDEKNSTLLLLIYPYLSFAITYEALPFCSFKITEVGLVQGNSDNSTAAPVSGLNVIQTRLRSTLETLKINLIRWLDTHAEDYPLYKPQGCVSTNGGDCGCDWIEQYYNGGYTTKTWNWYMKKNMPNPRAQLFTTPRKNTKIE